MEAVLHMEAANRDVKPPFSIGNYDYLSYGDIPLEVGDDNLGTNANHLVIGCPLEPMDYGNTRSHIPLVKSFECMKDRSGWGGTIYLDTMYYFQDHKYLIPIRTKIQSGPSQGLRLVHIPSLQHVRGQLSGIGESIEPVYGSIIEGLVENDAHFRTHKTHPLNEWLRDELVHHMSKIPACDIQFTKEGISDNIRRFGDRVQRVPYLYGLEHLRDIAKDISVMQDTLPSSFVSEDPVVGSIGKARLMTLPHSHDFQSSGRLPITKLPGILYNPFAFRGIADVIDRVILTDFNIDVVVQVDESIGFYHEHCAVNRLGVFCDHDIGAFSSETLLDGLINERRLAQILSLFVRHHSELSAEATHALRCQPIKIKLVKTMLDEAAILLYPYNSDGKAVPYGGVYFDLALLALAPLSIVGKPIHV